jgi:hypothetical protein
MRVRLGRRSRVASQDGLALVCLAGSPFAASRLQRPSVLAMACNASRIRSVSETR